MKCKRTATVPSALSHSVLQHSALKKESEGREIMTISGVSSSFLQMRYKVRTHPQSMEVKGGNANIDTWMVSLIHFWENISSKERHHCCLGAWAGLWAKWVDSGAGKPHLCRPPPQLGWSYLLPGWQQRFRPFINIKTQNNGMFSLSNTLRKSIRPTCNFLRF